MLLPITVHLEEDSQQTRFAPLDQRERQRQNFTLPLLVLRWCGVIESDPALDQRVGEAYS